MRLQAVLRVAVCIAMPQQVRSPATEALYAVSRTLRSNEFGDRTGGKQPLIWSGVKIFSSSTAFPPESQSRLCSARVLAAIMGELFSSMANQH
eukprot:1645207-Rhodomonas_salina.1